jgi:hypothetical protein
MGLLEETQVVALLEPVRTAPAYAGALPLLATLLMIDDIEVPGTRVDAGGRAAVMLARGFVAVALA